MLRELTCARTLDDVTHALAEGAAVIAGGTDFVPLYAAGAVSSETAVDISAVSDLAHIDEGATRVRIGAAVALHRVAGLVSAPGLLGAIRDGAALIGSPQTRRRGTLGGNACRSSPSGDTLPGLLLANAEMVAVSAHGHRVVPAAEFFTGPGANDLRDDEFLAWIDVPRRACASAYVRHTFRRSLDLATVGVATVIEDAGDGLRIRVGVGGAGPTPLATAGLLVDAGDRPTAELVDLLHEEVQDLISPISDARGSDWYRRRLVRPLLQRSLSRSRRFHQEGVAA